MNFKDYRKGLKTISPDHNASGKSVFYLSQEIKSLGFTDTTSGICRDPEYFIAVRDWDLPTTLQISPHFEGFSSFIAYVGLRLRISRIFSL